MKYHPGTLGSVRENNKLRLAASFGCKLKKIKNFEEIKCEKILNKQMYANTDRAEKYKYGWHGQYSHKSVYLFNIISTSINIMDEKNSPYFISSKFCFLVSTQMRQINVVCCSL